MGKRKSASWMYMSRLAAEKEYAFMKVDYYRFPRTFVANSPLGALPTRFPCPTPCRPGEALHPHGIHRCIPPVSRHFYPAVLPLLTIPCNTVGRLRTSRLLGNSTRSLWTSLSGLRAQASSTETSMNSTSSSAAKTVTQSLSTSRKWSARPTRTRSGKCRLRSSHMWPYAFCGLLNSGWSS